MKMIVAHDPAWADAFAAEANTLRPHLGEAALALHHIGSTAIAGIMAKPIIDILIEARSLEDIDTRTRAIEAIGYEARGEYGIAGRRYFKKARTLASRVGFHVHVYATGSDHIARHLRFRDYLLLKPDVAQDYAALKRSLSDPSGVLVADYADRKAGFVRRVEQQALLHFAENAV